MPEKPKSCVSIWSIAILSAAGCWFGWIDDNQQVMLASAAGFLAFVAFALTPRTHVRS